MNLDDLQKLCGEATTGNSWADTVDLEFLAVVRKYMPLLIAVAKAAKEHIAVYGVRTLNDEYIADALTELEKQ